MPAPSWNRRPEVYVTLVVKTLVVKTLVVKTLVVKTLAFWDLEAELSPSAVSPLTIECVLLLQNVFSYYRMCSLSHVLGPRGGAVAKCRKSYMCMMM